MYGYKKRAHACALLSLILILYPYENWYHHWILASLLEKERSYRVRKFFFHDIKIDRIHSFCMLLNGLLDKDARF